MTEYRDDVVVVGRGKNARLFIDDAECVMISPGNAHPHCRRAEDRFLQQFSLDRWQQRLFDVPLVLYLRELESLVLHKVRVHVELILKDQGVKSAMVASGPLKGVLCTPPVPACNHAIAFRSFDPKNLGVTSRGAPGFSFSPEQLKNFRKASGASHFPAFPYIDFWTTTALRETPMDGVLITFNELRRYFTNVDKIGDEEPTFVTTHPLFWLAVPKDESKNRLGEDLDEAKPSVSSVYYLLKRVDEIETSEDSRKWVFRPKADAIAAGTISPRLPSL